MRAPKPTIFDGGQRYRAAVDFVYAHFFLSQEIRRDASAHLKVRKYRRLYREAICQEKLGEIAASLRIIANSGQGIPRQAQHMLDELERLERMGQIANG